MALAVVSRTRVAPAAERRWLLGAARFMVLVGVCLVMSVLTRSEEHGFVFLNMNNLLNIVRNASILIIIGVGETITLTARDVDLSVGSVLSLTSVVAAIMLNRYGIPFPLAILAALLIGAVLGLINGLLITYVGLPPFIATYGTLWVLFGFAYLILQGAVIYGFPAGFRVIGNGHLFGIPMPIVVMTVVFLTGYLLLHHTTLGRRFFATGANIETARMSGIKVERVIIAAYAISGFLAAVAGLVLIAYTNGSEARIGDSYLLPVMAVVVMGGTSLAGGQGNLVGTLVAALIMAVIHNGMNILAVPAIWQSLVVGLLIIGTV
ncbi:MAG: transporter permease, partial [candidate division NC10 bacterium]|nr:transporter permease [candidate division NC10 bacterium]